MKKLLALISAVSLLFVLTACSGKCDICGKEGKVTKVTYMGESANLCSSCESLFNYGMSLAN